MANYNKGIKIYNWRYLTRKDFRYCRANPIGRYSNHNGMKPYRQMANGKLRRHKGDVGDHGWYKKFVDIWWIAF